MTEREWMIKLVAEMRLAAKGTIGSMNDPDAWCADYLIERGMLCPPCKVGDTVYRITPIYLFIKEYDVVGFHLGDWNCQDMCSQKIP